MPGQGSESTQTAPLRPPDTFGDAAKLLINTGNGADDLLVYRIEPDRILASGNGKVFTVFLAFDQAREKVRISREEGWPAF